ncbi:group II intron maturase-specific domain-containing protein [Paenibacillus thiaminolyticus]|uniref:group II intron maturase-specific domain-containing protein n=1 Tax=Paenibacillus thiaminolyticus TaxID=49283 RepID=UPI0021761A02|nr:group II intron maturase-specific domain-containing protein [Paenibacillus thiaminolyticus]
MSMKRQEYRPKGVEALSDAAEAAASARKIPDGNGRKGKLIHLLDSDLERKSVLPKDGKAKIHAKSLVEKVDSLESEIAKLLGRMPKSLAERMPFKVGYVQHAGTNRRTPVLFKNENSPMFTGLSLPREKVKKQPKMNIYAFHKDKSIQSFKDTIRARTHRRIPLTVFELIDSINPVIRGWGNYFQHGVEKVA